MVIGGLQKTSLIDYPEKISAVIFTQGCNFKCHYCHNPELIQSTRKSTIDPSEVLNFLFKRKKQLDGVVITGGEPTIQSDLSQYLSEIKSMGYSIKLDTNGSNPDIIKKLADKKLVDYIAMDIKAPLKRYAGITQIKIDTNKIKDSISHILQSKINHEFRTTISKAFLKAEDILGIGKLLVSLRGACHPGQNACHPEADAEGSRAEGSCILKSKKTRSLCSLDSSQAQNDISGIAAFQPKADSRNDTAFDTKYILQHFRNTNILNPAYSNAQNFSDLEISKLLTALRKHISIVNVR